jgi:transposase-like protein
MGDLSRFCRLSSECPEHGRRGAGNLTVCHRYGPGKSQRMLSCRACKVRFSERKGNPLFGSHLPEAKAVAVLHHLAEGVGVRKTGRLVGVNREAVASYAKKAGAHATVLHDELVAASPRTREAQLDEKWAFVAKKEKNCDPMTRPTPTRATVGTTSRSIRSTA